MQKCRAGNDVVEPAAALDAVHRRGGAGTGQVEERGERASVGIVGEVLHDGRQLPGAADHDAADGMHRLGVVTAQLTGHDPEVETVW